MKKQKKPRLSDIIPDEKYRKGIEEGLLSGQKWLGENGIFSELLQSVVDAALEGEMDHHLSKEQSAGLKNRRNGYGKKKVKTQVGELDLHPPRDRSGSFEPTIVEKRKKEIKGGLDEVIISLYAKGNSAQDIHRLLREIYGIEYSTSAISLITERILPKLNEWQQRPLKGCYSILYLDGMHFRVKEDGMFIDKCVYSLYAIDVDGERDVLGIYLSDAESASQWGIILEDLKRRGVQDILITCIDGLAGFKQAIEQVYPKAIVQRCIVHKIRNSIRFTSDKDKRPVCKGLKSIYTSATADQAKIALEAFKETWGKQGKRIAELWEKDWDELMAFMNFSQPIRRMIYTTNPVEALHRMIRKVTKSKGAWVNEKALIKQLYLTLMHSEESWKRKAFNHKSVQAELAEKFGERYTKWIEK